MTQVGAEGIALCALQGKVFEASVVALPACGSAVFVRRFMRSGLARRVDEWRTFDAGADPVGVVREVDAEYGGAPYGSEHYPTEVLHWMGYVYRYWCLATGDSSRHVHAISGAREMRGLYYPYHALDPALAVERILEAHGVDPDARPDDIARGVEALRRIRVNA